MRVTRSSVSAEVIGKWNKKVISNLQTEIRLHFWERLLRRGLRKHLVFLLSILQSLAKYLMPCKMWRNGDQVIREEDEKDCLNVVENGTLRCTQIFVRNYYSLINVERANRACIFEEIQCQWGLWWGCIALQCPSCSHYCG